MGTPSLYEDPFFYDQLAHLTAPADHSLYAARVEQHGGPVLELACGTGRVCFALAELGVETTGLDSSEQMISWARDQATKRGLPTQFHVADMRDFDLRQQALILLPYNSFNHLHTRPDIESCLHAVARHMSSESRFIIDTFNPNPRALHTVETEPRELLSFNEPVTGTPISLFEQNRYEPATQINHITWRFRAQGHGDLRVEHLEMRVFFPQELDSTLAWQGFEIEEKLGDYAGAPFESGSSKQIVICRRR